MQIKQHSKVKYLGCLMDKAMSGEAMALNVIHEINNKLNYFIVKIFFDTRTEMPSLQYTNTASY